MHRGLVPTLLAALLLSAQDDTQTSNAPEIEPSIGDLRVWRARSKQIEKVMAKVRVEPADRIGSTGGAVARLSLMSQVLITLRGVQAAADQGLAVEGIKPKFQLKLYRGSILVECVEAEVEVASPHGRVSGRAVSFLLEVTPQATRVVAVDGEITFTSSLGTVQLEPGQTTLARQTQGPENKAPANLERELSWVAAAEGPLNLVPNPGFEQALSGWTTDPYQGRPMPKADDTVRHTGKASARIDIPAGHTALPRCPLRTDLRLTPGIRYFLRVYIRLENYTIDGREGEVKVHAWFATDKSPRNFESNAVRGQGRWLCARIIFTAPDAVFGLGVPRFEEARKYTGTVWIDDVYLAPLAVGK